MKNIIFSQRGFSLIQGMLLAGALAAAALVSTRLLSDQKMAQKSMETRDQIEDLHSLLYATLQNREHCEKTFLNRWSGNAANVIPGLKAATPPELDEILTINDDVVLRVFPENGTVNVTEGQQNTYMNGNVLVSNMRLTYTEAISTARLFVTYERLSNDENKRTKNGYGAKSIQKEVVIRVQRDPFTTPTKPFVSCYAVSAGTNEPENDVNYEFCTEMNNNLELNPSGDLTQKYVFMWDPTTNTCLPNASCPVNQIYRGFDQYGQVQCANLNDLVDWGTIYTGTNGTCGVNKYIWFRATPDRKKVSIECTTTAPPVLTY